MHSKGDKIVLVPTGTRVGRAIERASASRTARSTLLTSRGSGWTGTAAACRAGRRHLSRFPAGNIAPSSHYMTIRIGPTILALLPDRSFAA